MSANPADAGPVIPEWTLADRLRKVRRHLGMSQGQIADLLGTNQRTYASWESEHSTPRNLVALAKRVEMVTRVPAAWILGIDLVTTTRTRGYQTPSSTLASTLALTSQRLTIYRCVDNGYRSSACVRANAEHTDVPKWARGVNNADTA